MRNNLIPAVLIAFFLASCSVGESAAVDCGNKPDSARLSPAEKRALASTVRQADRGCKEAAAGCKYDVYTLRNEISVVATLAPYDKKTKSCVRVKGGNSIFVYDLDGNFRKHIPGM